jgi:hypothetical protein
MDHLTYYTVETAQVGTSKQGEKDPCKRRIAVRYEKWRDYTRSDLPGQPAGKGTPCSQGEATLSERITFSIDMRVG